MGLVAYHLFQNSFDQKFAKSRGCSCFKSVWIEVKKGKEGVSCL